MAKTKPCFACKQVKPINDFYRHSGMADGHLNKCKDCVRAAERHRRATNPAVQEYDRFRAKLPHRRDNAKRVLKRWIENNPEKYVARYTFTNAVRDGRAERKSECEQCGSTKNVCGVQSDIREPLQVRWICARCNHRNRAAAEISENVT